MRNTIVSPYFDEGKYKGQDTVHQGVRIPLRKYPLEQLLKELSRRAQRIIKSEYDAFEYRFVTDSDIAALREMWFDPEDPEFPKTLDRTGHWGFGCWHQGVLVGGIFVRRQGSNLFLHQLVACEQGRKMQVPTLLIWHVARQFNLGEGKLSTPIHAFDIGVSYNPKRYEFFLNFAVEKYPIILKKPFYVPVIRLSPFRTFVDKKPNYTNQLFANKKDKVTFFPRAVYALEAVLRHLELKDKDIVLIVKTFKGPFITGCVTSTIAKVCDWRVEGEDQYDPAEVKAVIAVHEFGIAISGEREQLCARFQAMGVPVIEDCAWCAPNYWGWSQFQIFSMQKMLNINYGGVLRGVEIPDAKLWDWGLLDSFKRDKFGWENVGDVGQLQRVKNWLRYNELAKDDGMWPDSRMDFETAVASGTWLPTVYMQQFETDAEADAVVARLEEFGIQAGRYYPEPVVYLPIHQNMTLAEVEYMFAVVRGYFNLCRDYQGKINEEGHHD